MSLCKFQLTAWQQKFVDDFVASNSQRNMLVTGVGNGKTVTSLHAADAKLKSGEFRRLLVISPFNVSHEQWRHVARDFDIRLDPEIDGLYGEDTSGWSLTYQSLREERMLAPLTEEASRGGLLLIVDEVDRYQSRAIKVCDKLLSLNPSNQCLFLSTFPLIGREIDSKFEFGREFLFEPRVIALPETKVQIVKYSPSFQLLEGFKQRTHNLDELDWRQFEKLISELLETDGYNIRLMSGRKDGGVDIIAEKDLGENGMFKALWQAKKYSASRRIGISTIRELADVRVEHKASKAIIVTSSFLTSGALQRIERDKFLLGKVDRYDLKAWIERKLHEH